MNILKIPQKVLKKRFKKCSKRKVGHGDNGGVGDRLSLTVVMIVVMMVMVLMMATIT